MRVCQFRHIRTSIIHFFSPWHLKSTVRMLRRSVAEVLVHYVDQRKAFGIAPDILREQLDQADLPVAAPACRVGGADHVSAVAYSQLRGRRLLREKLQS